MEKEKEILNDLINEILETKLIFKDIFYKIENKKEYYIKLDYKDRTDTIYYNNFLQVVSYLQGIRKTIYSLERILKNEK